MDNAYYQVSLLWCLKEIVTLENVSLEALWFKCVLELYLPDSFSLQRSMLCSFEGSTRPLPFLNCCGRNNLAKLAGPR